MNLVRFGEEGVILNAEFVVRKQLLNPAVFLSILKIRLSSVALQLRAEMTACWFVLWVKCDEDSADVREL
jgi:hypothetical protein